jgi:hypothetical protein
LEKHIRSWTANFKLCDDIKPSRAHWFERARACTHK